MGFIGDFIGDIFGGSETTTPAGLTSEQRQLVQSQVELAEFQLQELQNQQQLQNEVFGAVEPAVAGFDEFVDQQGGTDIGGVQDELLQDQLERLRAGGAATEEETRLINDAVERALAAGETDITRFLEQNLETLRDELAPQLGLRPGDTPILDRGARVAGEASRQQGQLVNTLRGQQAQTLLNFPLQRTATLGLLAQGQQDVAQNIQQFQANLRQSAFTNRLQLAGARSTAGLGLAGVAAPNIGPAFASQGSTTTTSPGLGGILGGIGGVLTGIGAVTGG